MRSVMSVPPDTASGEKASTNPELPRLADSDPPPSLNSIGKQRLILYRLKSINDSFKL